MKYNYRLVLKKDSTENWEGNAYIPLEGEPCFDTNTKEFKIGNGIDRFPDLPAITGTASGGEATEVDFSSLGLHQVTEDGKTGWALIQDNRDNKVSIGDGAIDLSTAAEGGEYGAQGNNSFIVGANNLAKGLCSTVVGAGNIDYGNKNFISGSFNIIGALINLEGMEPQENKILITPKEDADAEEYNISVGDEIDFIFKRVDSEELDIPIVKIYTYNVIEFNNDDETEPYFIVDGDLTTISNDLNLLKIINKTKSLIQDHTFSSTIGTKCFSSGFASHAEGTQTTASGGISHAEGIETTASGYASHAEGYNTRASGDKSHAEGYNVRASGENSHSEGGDTTSSGHNSHAEGTQTTASGDNSHAEGIETTASGENSQSEGAYSTASGYASHTEGYETTASGRNSHSEGAYSTASGYASHAEGYETTASGKNSHSEGYNSSASTNCSHAEGYKTIASGDESTNSYFPGKGSHAEGYKTIASGSASHAEGSLTLANNIDSHAEGLRTESTGIASHAEGYKTKAEGENSHAEGRFNVAQGMYSHAEGGFNTAEGWGSHAEGNNTVSTGPRSHAEGMNTIAQNDSMHAAGKFNIGTATDTIHETGIGTSDTDRKNAFEIYTDGKIVAPELTTALIDDRNTPARVLVTKEWVELNSSGEIIRVIENNKMGLRLASESAEDHVEIGDNAIDLTYVYTTSSSSSSSSSSSAEYGAQGNYSFSTGFNTTALGNSSHAEGYKTTASGYASHAEGYGTIAKNWSSHAAGTYNVGTSNDTIYEIGIGTNSSGDIERRNGFEIYWDGKVKAPEATPSIVDSDLQNLVPLSYLLSAEFGNKLPTSDPAVAGKIWNDNGILKVSLG